MTPAQALAHLRDFPLPEEWELGDQLGQQDCAAVFALVNAYDRAVNALEFLLHHPEEGRSLAAKVLLEVPRATSFQQPAEPSPLADAVAKALARGDKLEYHKDRQAKLNWTEKYPKPLQGEQ